MYLPNLNKKLPHEGKISPLSLQNFQSLIDKNWRFQKKFTAEVKHVERPEENFVQGQALPVMP